MNEKFCPFCRSQSTANCAHLSLAVEGREFVRRCVEACQAQGLWQTFCQHYRDGLQQSGEWSPDREDFTWLETAFCERFLRRLHWFGGMDHEWRSGLDPSKGGYCVLLWSRDPERLWWDLRDEIERQANQPASLFPSRQSELGDLAGVLSPAAPARHPAPVAL